MAFGSNRKSAATSNAGTQTRAQIDSWFGEKVQFKGDMHFEGKVRIDGKFEGNIVSKNDGILDVSKTAEIIGDVHVPQLLLHGRIQGNIQVNSLNIGSDGTLVGDGEYSEINVDVGGKINGRLQERKQEATKDNKAVTTNNTNNRHGKK
ncbi:MAG: polymer-forming cytoskeletal protein [Mariprofundales bacterium]